MFCAKVIFVLFSCVFLTSICLAAPTDDDAPFFRKDYTYVEAADAFFKEHKVRTTWQEAVSTCQAEGAVLATPGSAAEAQQILGRVQADTGEVWIGMHDMFSEGNFITLTGQAPSYDNWNPGEPNDVGNEEDCVVMMKNEKLNDVPCKYKYRYVCYLPRSRVTSNTLCETYDLDYFYNIEADRCYKLHTVPKTWHEAFRICQLEQAELAIINSEEEAKILVDALATVPASSLPGNFEKDQAFLGFNDLITPGTHRTVDGKTLEEVGYNSWQAGQPDNWEGKEHCGTMYRNGKLNDHNCEVRALYYCEKILGSDTVAPLINTRFGPTRNKAQIRVQK